MWYGAQFPIVGKCVCHTLVFGRSRVFKTIFFLFRKIFENHVKKGKFQGIIMTILCIYPNKIRIYQIRNLRIKNISILHTKYENQTKYEEEKSWQKSQF